MTFGLSISKGAQTGDGHWIPDVNCQLQLECIVCTYHQHRGSSGVRVGPFPLLPLHQSRH